MFTAYTWLSLRNAHLGHLCRRQTISVLFSITEEHLQTIKIPFAQGTEAFSFLAKLAAAKTFRGIGFWRLFPLILCILALRHGMGFLSLSDKYPLIARSPSSMPS